MATHGPAPHKQAARPSAADGWQNATVVAMRPRDDVAYKPQVDKRAPARGILLGLVVAGCMWAVVLYVVVRAVH